MELAARRVYSLSSMTSGDSVVFIMIPLLIAVSWATPDFTYTTGPAAKIRELFVSAGDDSWTSQSDLKEAICLLRVTADLLAREEGLFYKLYLAQEIKTALENITTSSVIDGYKEHDGIFVFDDRLGDSFRMPTLDLRVNWATNEQRILASGLVRQILKIARELQPDATNHSTTNSTAEVTYVDILPLNLAETGLENIENQQFWKVFKRSLASSEVPHNLRPILQTVDVECFSEWSHYDQTCSEEAGRVVCRVNENKKLHLKQILASIETTASNIKTSKPNVDDVSRHRMIILVMGNHAKLKEALKLTATSYSGLANETTWVHPDAFSFGEVLRQEGDFETLEFMEKLGFSTLLTFPTQNFSDAELKKFRNLLKSKSCSPSSTQRALTTVKTLKAIFKEQPGLPETVEAWSLSLMGFRNRSAVQIIQNSPWMFDEAWTANGAGSRPSNHPATLRTDVVSKRQLIQEFAATATKCDQIGSIAIKTMDPFSLDSVKRIYDTPDYFPDKAIIPRNHGFAISVKCRYSSQMGAELSCSGVDEGLTSCIQAASKKREVNSTVSSSNAAASASGKHK